MSGIRTHNFSGDRDMNTHPSSNGRHFINNDGVACARTGCISCKSKQIYRKPILYHNMEMERVRWYYQVISYLMTVIPETYSAH